MTHDLQKVLHEQNSTLVQQKVIAIHKVNHMLANTKKNVLSKIAELHATEHCKHSCYLTFNRVFNFGPNMDAIGFRQEGLTSE